MAKLNEEINKIIRVNLPRFIWLEIKVCHEVLNDLSNADQLVSVLVKNGISWGKNYNDQQNVRCIEEDEYEMVMKRVKIKYKLIITAALK